jgi:TBC1 domain family member 15
MVEIKHVPEPSSPVLSPAAGADESRHRLVFSKSKVYVHPTAYARDNIPGFVALVKRVCA